ncbi:MAG: xanthine dehydrogenase family protein molybdopterin-binding subunit [Pseudomonadota bacterium]
MTKLHPHTDFKTNRRDFLAGTAGLVVGASLPLGHRAIAQTEAATTGLNAFVKVAADNTVTVLVKHIEFGQGPLTGLATLVADEMDASWDQIRAETAPADVSTYANAAFGVQGTGGSTAIFSSWEPMRKAGAQAKAMLVAAAAADWGVPAAEISVSNGQISHAGSGKRSGFGAFAEAASGLTPPDAPKMKTAEERTLIGTDLPKLDTAAKTTGAATYGQDVFREGMLVAVVAHAPLFGATVESFDASKALQVKGVRAVKQVPSGVAVYADNTYAAFKGRDALKVAWSDATAERRSTAQIMSEYVSLVEAGPGEAATDQGDAPGGLETATTKVDAIYRFPFLAHTPMEALNGVAEYTDDGAEVWMGSQLQTLDQAVLAQTLGFENPMSVKLNTMFAGGSFGRLATPTSHFAAEIASVLKAQDEKNPVKLVWSREDDVRGGYYRPLTVHKVSAGLDDDGNIVGWDQTIASPSLVKGSSFEALVMPNGGLDPSVYEGAQDPCYGIENFRVTAKMPDSKVPVLWWRSVGHTHTGYVLETMIDELLQKAGKDAVEGRLAMMKDDRARDAAVLRRVAEMADWGRAPAPGHAFGVAVHKSFNSYVAQIAEVSLNGNVPVVHKVWCAVDCGVAVNPNVIAAQMEGGIGFGLGAILFDQITLDDGGKVREANWDSYRMLRIHEMPEVDVAIVESNEAPTGVGEPGTPPIGPAIANAVRQLTGETPRDLPIVKPYTA